MATPEDTLENSHALSFQNNQLGVRAELIIDHPGMEQLSPEDRGSLERLLAAASYTFTLLVHVKPEMRPADWRNQGRKLLDDIHETIFDLEGGLPQGFMRGMLGLDIEVPPYEEEPGQISRIA